MSSIPARWILIFCLCFRSCREQLQAIFVLCNCIAWHLISTQESKYSMDRGVQMDKLRSSDNYFQKFICDVLLWCALMLQYSWGQTVSVQIMFCVQVWVRAPHNRGRGCGLCTREGGLHSPEKQGKSACRLEIRANLRFRGRKRGRPGAQNCPQMGQDLSRKGRHFTDPQCPSLVPENWLQDYCQNMKIHSSIVRPIWFETLAFWILKSSKQTFIMFIL